MDPLSHTDHLPSESVYVVFSLETPPGDGVVSGEWCRWCGGVGRCGCSGVNGVLVELCASGGIRGGFTFGDNISP